MTAFWRIFYSFFIYFFLVISEHKKIDEGIYEAEPHSRSIRETIQEAERRSRQPEGQEGRIVHKCGENPAGFHDKSRDHTYYKRPQTEAKTQDAPWSEAEAEFSETAHVEAVQAFDNEDEDVVEAIEALFLREEADQAIEEYNVTAVPMEVATEAVLASEAAENKRRKFGKYSTLT